MSEVSTNVQYTDGLGDKWLERELKHVNLGDTRLNKRLIKTGYCIEGKASGSIIITLNLHTFQKDNVV